MSELEGPVRDWEVVTARFALPDVLRQIVASKTWIVRVGIDIDRKQRRKHRDSIRLYENIGLVMEEWEYWRKQLPEGSRPGTGERWQIVQFIRESNDEVPWPLLTVLGKNMDGDMYLATSHRRQKAWGARFLARDDIHSRGEL